MNRIFGNSSKKDGSAPPTAALDSAISNLDTKSTSLNSKIQSLTREICQINAEMSKYPPNSSNYQSLKQKALRVLQQKKSYEHQRDQIMQQSFNMESTNFMIGTVQDSVTQVKAMKMAKKELGSQLKSIDIDQVMNLRDDLEDIMMDSSELQEVLSRSYEIPGGLDDTELESELTTYTSDIMDKESGSASYLDDISSPGAMADSVNNGSSNFLNRSLKSKGEQNLL